MGSYGIGPARHDGGRRRAAPRRARDRLAAAIAPYDVHVVSPARRLEDAGRGGRSSALEAAGARRPARRPRAARRREVRRRRPDRLPRTASPSAGRRSRTARWTCACVRTARSSACRCEVGRRSDGENAAGSASGRSAPTVERLMAETGVDLPRPRRQDGPLRRLPQPHRARQPAGAVERRRRAARAGARRRAGALPRVPDARDHRAARADARAHRPAL